MDDAQRYSIAGDGGGRAVALDLGSNTFHLLLADWSDDGWRPCLRRGEVVGLATADLAAAKGMTSAPPRAFELSAAAMARGWAALAEVAPLLREATALRVVGTQALRAARNRDVFVARAEAILQCPVEVIDGAEEARLIWLGVHSDFCSRELASGKPAAGEPAAGDGERVVVDIGGGSTELVRGRGERITALTSVPLGCLALRTAFPAGRVDAATLRTVRAAARARFTAQWPAGAAPLQAGVGCSGTLLAIGAVLAALGYPAGAIERDGLDRLWRELCRYRHLDDVDLPALCERRRPLFVTGVVIATALFDALGLERLVLTERALREGLMEQMWRDAWAAGRLGNRTAAALRA